VPATAGQTPLQARIRAENLQHVRREGSVPPFECTAELQTTVVGKQ
jgi:hypothetical protein